MDEDPVVTSEKTQPIASDNLKLIRGIGPIAENHLRTASVLTFAQLAAMSPKGIFEIVGKIPGLSIQRILKQDWIGQARQLATAVAQLDPPNDQALADRQRYARYKVELLIDEAGNLRRTSISDLQGPDKASWAGWVQARLVHFIVKNAELNAQSVKEMGYTELAVASVTQPSVPASIPRTQALDSVQSSPASLGLTGVPRLRQFVPVSKNTGLPSMVIAKNRPFSTWVSLDFSEIVISGTDSMNCQVTVQAKNKDLDQVQVLGKASGTTMPEQELVFDIDCTPLSLGTYSLEASVALSPASKESLTETGITTVFEGILFQVY